MNAVVYLWCMEKIQKDDVINLGMNYIKSLKEFQIIGNGYILYCNNIYDLLATGNYNYNTKCFGNADNPTSITTIVKKTKDELELSEVEKEIKKLEDKFNIKVSVEK